MTVVSFGRRGAVRNAEQYAQFKDYSEIRYGNCTPTDIDGGLDHNGKAFTFFELKYGAAEMPYGQRLYLQRLCDAVQESGRESIVIVGTHFCAPADMIPVHEVPVTEIRFHGEWRSPKQPCTCKELSDLFRGWALDKKAGK